MPLATDYSPSRREGTIGGPGAVEALSAALKADANWQVRRGAARALETIGDPGAVL